jgi:hypothetical protein
VRKRAVLGIHDAPVRGFQHRAQFADGQRAERNGCVGRPEFRRPDHKPKVGEKRREFEFLSAREVGPIEQNQAAHSLGEPQQLGRTRIPRRVARRDQCSDSRRRIARRSAHIG